MTETIRYHQKLMFSYILSLLCPEQISQKPTFWEKRDAFQMANVFETKFSQAPNNKWNLSKMTLAGNLWNCPARILDENLMAILTEDTNGVAIDYHNSFLDVKNIDWRVCHHPRGIWVDVSDRCLSKSFWNGVWAGWFDYGNTYGRRKTLCSSLERRKTRGVKWSRPW